MANPASIDAQRYLKNIEYPATKAEILDTAQEEGAYDILLDTMRERLPDAVFDSATDVSRGLSNK